MTARRDNVIRDADIWRAAMAIEGSGLRRSAARGGDMAGAATWHRILDAIERLQAQKPAEGEPVH